MKKSVMTRMLPVTIDKRETCLTYALKRIGLYGNVQACTVLDLEEEFEFIPFSYEILKRGDLVTWCENRKEIEVPWTIDGKLTLVEETVTIDFHIGVVEEKQKKNQVGEIQYRVFLSDCTRKVFEGVPSLRIREIGKSEGKVREPDFILRLKESI